mmetsp:Transcript_30626/g.80180  ORF Transcript_30626/g.80180 Transcript_30626/m.80180 type:complete len:301 (+) Transcript_30626:380-1282(+)
MPKYLAEGYAPQQILGAIATARGRRLSAVMRSTGAGSSAPPSPRSHSRPNSWREPRADAAPDPHSQPHQPPLATAAPAEVPVVWVVARQRADGAAASWCVDGLLRRLADSDDAAVLALLKECKIVVVPNVNPTGTRLAHCRGNASGSNLAASWGGEKPDPKTAETAVCAEAMGAKPPAFVLSIGFDPTSTSVQVTPFCATASATAGAIQSLHRFCGGLDRANPDCTQHNRTKAPDGVNAAGTLPHWVSDKFSCPVVTLQLPKCTPTHDWSPARCTSIGRACVDGLRAFVGTATADNDSIA